MYISTINKNVILSIITKLPARFYTKDVSSHPDMIHGHPGLSEHSHYHSFVGKFLKKLKDEKGNLILTEIEKKTNKGSLWEKVGAIRNEEVREEPMQLINNFYRLNDDEDEIGIGPQCGSDNSFKARMRLHQSRYRAEILKLPYGTGPTKKANTRYGNMLKVENGYTGANFLNEKIFKVVKDRLSQQNGAVEPFRLLNNMLSSQPMCFNLFAMMKDDNELATKFWQNHFPDIDKITRLEFEFSPEPKWKYLDDRTAFDAYFEYLNQNGEKGFIGIETKLTESFSPTMYDSAIYRKWTELIDSPWNPESSDMLHYSQHNQLWRDHLLAVSIFRQPDSDFKDFKFVLVSHPDDNECSASTAGYSKLLRSEDNTFIHITLDKLVKVFDGMDLGDDLSKWLKDFRLRYLELDLTSIERGNKKF